MREHPEAVRSVILDSVLPSIATIPGFWLNTHAGFDNLFQACAAEPACSAAHPRLEETSTGLVNKLEVEPLTTTVSDAATGENIGCCSCPGLGRGRNSTGVTVTIMLYVGAADHLSRGSENSQAPLLAAEALFILPQGVWWHTGPLTNSDVPD
jgi:hypothetical protein